MATAPAKLATRPLDATARDKPRVALGIAVAGLTANVLIVLTSGLVRLTGSGLGCPTWPRCVEDSFVTTPEMGVHGVVEFGNRVLGILVGLITIAMLIAVVRNRRRSGTTIVLAAGGLVGVLAQGLIGGLSVRRELAPEIVTVHFLVSMIIVAAITVLVDVLRRPRARRQLPAHRAVGWLVAALPVVLTVVLVLGTLITGSGPHAGDEGARRFDLNPATLSWLHADAIVFFLGLQIAALIALRVTKAPQALQRASLMLLGASLIQGLIGYLQYVLELPVALVAAHILGAALVTLATTHLVTTAWRSTAPASPAARHPS